MIRIIAELAEFLQSGNISPVLSPFKQRFGPEETRSVASSLLRWLRTPLHRPWDLNPNYQWCMNLQVLIDEIEELGQVLEIVDNRLRFKEHVSEDTKAEIRCAVNRLHRPILMT